MMNKAFKEALLKRTHAPPDVKKEKPVIKIINRILRDTFCQLEFEMEEIFTRFQNNFYFLVGDSGTISACDGTVSILWCPSPKKEKDSIEIIVSHLSQESTFEEDMLLFDFTFLSDSFYHCLKDVELKCDFPGLCVRTKFEVQKITRSENSIYFHLKEKETCNTIDIFNKAKNLFS